MLPKLKPDRLLAKSVEDKWKGSYSLVGHTADVVRAVSQIIDTLGVRLIQQFDLDCSLAYLRDTTRLAAYLHDWGKGNDHFQGVVRSKMPKTSPQRFPIKNPQLIRHEVASILLAWEFRDWLKEHPGDLMTALAAAGGHHLKLGGEGGEQTDEIGKLRPCGDNQLHLYLFHKDFKRLLRFGIKQIGLPSTLNLAHKPKTTWTVTEIKQRCEDLLIGDNGFVDWNCNSNLVAVVKALLVAGDAIGSALPQTHFKLDQWISSTLEEHLLTEADLERVIKARLGDHDLRQFQVGLGKIESRVGLARAGCGTGKTLGAYNWAKRHAVGRKLFFCYPTTGTSTEGFLDYAKNQVESELMHSKADVDLALAETGEEADAGDAVINEAELKLSSFKAWEAQVVVCTVDAVLGLMQCNRRPMYSFPAIANAAFVFDEVHCYDNALFGALLRFLATVKAPVLLMSASFLPAQLKAIEEAVGEEPNIIPGPSDIEENPRYRFYYSEQPNWERVEQELASGGKVLWVCNQVSTAIGIYEEAKQWGLNTLLYHSRFKYKDRVEHHRSVIDAFKEECKEPVLAVTTQVAEMSLDLSATLLVSQIADPAALIQRLGRLNRRFCGHALDALFYPDGKPFPYDQDQRDRGLAMIQTFEGDVCQADLAGWLEQNATEIQPKTDSVFLDGEWRTYPAPLREGGVTITSLLEEDMETIKTLPSSKIKLYTVPLLANDADQVKTWERYKNYPVAPRTQWEYCSQKGAFAVKEGKD